MEDSILDDVQASPKLQRSPAEHRFFLVLFAVQYLSLPIVFFNNNMSGLLFFVVGAFAAGFVHVFMGIWQLVSAAIRLAKGSDKRRQLYLMMAGINFVLIFLFIFGEGFLGVFGAGMGLFLSTVLLPHALAWYYWYICYSESKYTVN